MAKGFLIDQDGVIYVEDQIIPGADIFIKNLQKENIPFTFMTNNSQRSPLDAVRKLAKMGIDVGEENVYTSAMATAHFMSQQYPKGTAYVLGEGGLISSLHENGFTLVQNDPDFVVVGEGINFTLEMVKKAINFILSGAKFIATNLDPSPRKLGWNNLGIAAVVSMIESATGKRAFSVGKPSPVMMRLARKHIGLATDEVTVIGDTLATDIQGGVQVGYNTILTLSGMSKKEQLNDFPFKPDMVIDSIADLELPLPWW
ncbi:HAD-IIA family hydrolase [Roseivirga misakiensis]|uniref:HAD family hydrolase n=1 Tax=Roseivirga misakiensis TaxID=1563681 RepID=A0A1E5T802_9BACT|nr:HAD-IIA family hydrolase [Roseivirga misakiensis]OEK07501.1 HAD family hydrolase [Roseivirga misakiensis]